IVPGRLDAADRAAVLDAAVLLIALSDGSGFPWRAVEAMVLGVPVVACDSPVHHEVLRGRAFSWRDHAERVWALHAEL
ncbi:MAG: hypothetical protein K0S70_1657, partial [Microbacterium sp.]|nr:hypothetical protein [Microbacterium sp.]